MNKRNYISLFSVFVIVLFALQSCHVDPVIKDELPADNIRLIVPSGWPAPVYDFSTNLLTEEGFVLGRKLFYDTQLSRNNTISCGSCHQQFAAFSHLDHAVSHGIDGLLGTRNAPGLFNMNWNTSFMWDGGINHIEVQPLGPIANVVEMDEDINNVVSKLQGDADYRRLFREAFGTETVTTQLILKAMAQFQGMLVSYNSKYDRYTRGETSLSANEMSGLNLFQQKCNSCHTAPLFTNYQFMNNGLDSVFVDAGRARITLLAADSGTFKVPSLRNIALTRQYMHDGRFETLEEVLDHYSSGVVNSSTISADVVGGIPLTAQEKADIISFLKTLSDYTFINDPRFADPF